MLRKDSKKVGAESPVVFVHSLFRSASTYFYNALKRTGNFHVYHEPMHEVIASLPDAWDELTGRKDQIKSALRHDFLVGCYFDEYSHLLPSIKMTFKSEFSFDYYFMGEKEHAPELKGYIDLLVDGAPKAPVLQCTRTSGRIVWLKENYLSKHIFLLRNPWDQWYSYKVDSYIATTPRIIYSQSNASAVLKAVFDASGACPLRGCNSQDKFAYGYSHRLPPTQDYFLFFGLWLHSFVCGKKNCDVFIDMDTLCSTESYREHYLSKLEDIGIRSVEFSDAKLHRTIFDTRELPAFRKVEERVLEIYRQHGIPVATACEYLQNARQESFVTLKSLGKSTSDILEDAYRMRELVLARDDQIASLDQFVIKRDSQIASLNQSVIERDSQIASLNRSVIERDDQIASLDQFVIKRDSQIASLNQSVIERDSQIASLDQFVIKRDSQIASLNQSVIERDSQIASLDQSVIERDIQIASLNRSVIERDIQITSLNQSVIERDSQIASLNRSVIERDSQIASFNQSVIERDSQIASLDQSVIERDSQIASLNRSVIERDSQVASLRRALSARETVIQAIKTSNSWKFTTPFRAMSRIFKRKESLQLKQMNGSLSVAPGPNAFFTICAKNFLAHARVLYNSVRPHYPNARFFVVLCDRVDGFFDTALEPFEFVFLEDLKLPNISEMSERYNITEFNTAVKPFAFMHLMSEFNFDSVVYLDPDLLFVDKMLELDQLLDDGAEAVLTPHIIQPAEHDEIHDGKMLLFGIYNLGFLALRNTPAVNIFLQWWGRRLERHCVIRLEEGMFVDQKWADLLPAFVSGARVIHHPGYNVAYWNLPQRKITRNGDRWLANGEPLRFVHFSGNKIDDVTVFSRHSQQVTIESIGDLRELLDIYRQQVYRQGHAFYRALPYAYSWNGEAGINLHTPKELDLASEQVSPAALRVNALPISTESLSGGHSFIRNRIAVLRQAIPIAKTLSGGWGPFALRAWSAYRRHGWRYVKIKAVELSGFRSPPPVSGHQAQETEQRGIRSRRLLYLDWAIPKPDQDAASVTATLLMQIVDTLGYKVTFVPCGLKYEEGYYEDLIAANVEALVYPAIHSVTEWLVANAKHFDICIMARGPVVWPHLETLKTFAPNLRLIFNTVDLHYLREFRQAELANDEKGRQAALSIRDQEFELIDKCDLTILLSSEELYKIREVRPEAPLAVLPVVFKDIPGSTKPYSERSDILFIGSFPHQPNIDAVIYFVEAVFPIIRRRIPDIRFKVIGANPPELIRRLAEAAGIEILGFVKDLDPIFADIKLSVAPLRYGAGIKGKIGTSLCYGVPCVATPVAVEGMGLTAGRNVLVGETPEELADAICEVYLDADRWSFLSAEGLRFVQDNYSVEVIRERVKNLLFAVTEGWRPIHSSVELDSWESFQKHVTRMEQEYERRILREEALLPSDGADSFSTPGFCCVCGTNTRFLTSFMYSTGNTPDGRPMPNWREHMQCAHCGLVNRMRAALNALHTLAQPDRDSRIYITERVTPIYRWLEVRYPNLVGSEYLGSEREPGSMGDGIRHEDVMDLSFEGNSFDRVLSFDVLEHVPDPERAFRELYRVLNPGGVLIFSVPFSSTSKTDVIRATLLQDGTIKHHLPAEYHGNPVDPDGGALCFRYFGWELLDSLRSIGFHKVRCLCYWSEAQGYLGREQYLFIATRKS